MATATSFLTLMAQLAVESGLSETEIEQRFAYKLSAATITTTTFTTTDPNSMKLATTANPTRLQGLHIYLETNAEERIITTLSVTASVATVTFVGANATAVGTASNAWITRVPWSEIKALVNDALEREFVECFIPLSHGPDSADLQDSDSVDTDWTETNATDTVQTTVAEVFAGARSLVVTDSGSGGGYTQSTLMRMGHGYSMAIMKSDTGTSGLRVVDDTGNTIHTISTTQEDWVFMKRQFTLDATDEGARLQLLESTASAAGDWQFAWMVKEGVRLFNIPSWVDERFKLKTIARARFYERGDEADTWMADSIDLERLSEGDEEDYRFINRTADANPHQVILGRHIALDEPLFLIIEAPWTIPYGVAATYTTDASTSLCPVRALTAHVRMLIAERYPNMFGAGYEAARRDVAQIAALRKTEPPRERIKVRGLFR